MKVTRRRLVLGSMLLALAFVGLVLWLRSQGPISYSSYTAIQRGMTRKDVEAMLGGPPWCDADGYVEEEIIVSSPDFSLIDPEVKSNHVWGRRRLEIEVCFDRDDKVVSKRFLVVHRENDLLHRIRRWLGL